MSEAGVIPTTEDRARAALEASRPTLTDWHVEGEMECPDCGSSFQVNCPLEDVVKFSIVHECTAATMPP